MEQLKETIKKFLRTEYNAEPGDYEDLFDSGVLDSFDAIAYFSFLTEVSGCPLKFDEEDNRWFRTIAGAVQKIEKAKDHYGALSGW